MLDSDWMWRRIPETTRQRDADKAVGFYPPAVVWLDPAGDELATMLRAGVVQGSPAFTRISQATYRGIDGVLRYATPGILRDAHYTQNPVTDAPERTILLEGERASLVTISEPTKAQLSVSSAGTTDAASAVPPFAAMIQFPAASQQDYAYAPAVIAPSTEYTVSVYVIMDDGGAPVLGTDLEVVLATTAISTDPRVEEIGGGLYRVSARGTSSAAPSQSCGIVRQISDTDRAFRVAGFQCEAAVFPTSYIQKTGQTEPRAADNLSFPFAAAPQEMTAYARLILSAAPLALASGMILAVGSTSAGLWYLRFATDGSPQVAHFSGVASVDAAVAAGAAKAGDLLEVRGVLLKSGAVQIGTSLNGATEVVSAVSAANALNTVWSAETVHLGRRALVPSDINPAILLTDALLLKGARSLAECRRKAGVS